MRAQAQMSRFLCNSAYISNNNYKMSVVDEAMIYCRDDSESGISSSSSVNGNSCTMLADDRRYSFNLEELDYLDELGSFSSEYNRVDSYVYRSDSTGNEIIRRGTYYRYGPTKCLKHNQEFRFFCIKCVKKICPECIIKNHGVCRFEPLHSYTKKLCQSALEEDQLDFRTLKTNVMQVQHSFDYKTECIKKEINNAAGRVIAEVQEKRRQLLRKLDYIQKLKTESWKHQIELCDRALKKLFNYQKYSRRLDIRDINVFRRSILTAIGSELDFIEDGNLDFAADSLPKFSLGEIKISASPKKSVVITPDISHSHKFNACTVVIRDHTEAEVKGIDYSVSATLQDINQNFVYLVIVNLKHGNYKIVYYPTTEGKHLLYVYLNSVPIGRSPYEIYVTCDSTKPKAFPTLIIGGGGDDTVSRPWGVCADFEGRIIVTDRGHNCIKIFGEDGQFLLSFGKEGSEPGEFLKPAGIAVDRVLRRIVVADKDNNRVQIFSYEGKFLLEFGSPGEEDGEFSYPWDVSVSQTSLIAVSDSRNRRIQLFNENGEFIRKFSFHVRNMREIELPRGLAFRPDGSLMVTDFNKHQVILLNEDFETVKGFGSEGSDITQFFRPQSIDIDPEGKFAVADCKNHRVQIFLPDGELSSVIGTFGNKAGEIDSPQGICFLPNKRIAVAELGNNRVQVFELP